jgi:hypothetical protein
MQDYFIFDEKELVRIGLVCLDCNTESVFDLTRDQSAITNRGCPGCGKELVKCWATPQRQEYNWITWYRKVQMDTSKGVLVRFYFKRNEQFAPNSN